MSRYQHLLGRPAPPRIWEIEKGHIRAFADAIGDPNPIYRDESVALAAGLRGIPAPPTFSTALRPNDPREGIDLDWRKLLHGAQEYQFERTLFAGDRVVVTAHIAEVSEKRGKSGLMDVLVIETEGTDATNGEVVFTGRSTVLIRQ